MQVPVVGDRRETTVPSTLGSRAETTQNPLDIENIARQNIGQQQCSQISLKASCTTLRALFLSPQVRECDRILLCAYIIQELQLLPFGKEEPKVNEKSLKSEDKKSFQVDLEAFKQAVTKSKERVQEVEALQKKVAEVKAAEELPSELFKEYATLFAACKEMQTELKKTQEASAHLLQLKENIKSSQKNLKERSDFLQSQFQGLLAKWSDLENAVRGSWVNWTFKVIHSPYESTKKPYCGDYQPAPKQEIPVQEMVKAISKSFLWGSFLPELQGEDNGLGGDLSQAVDNIIAKFHNAPKDDKELKAHKEERAYCLNTLAQGCILKTTVLSDIEEENFAKLFKRIWQLQRDEAHLSAAIEKYAAEIAMACSNPTETSPILKDSYQPLYVKGKELKEKLEKCQSDLDKLKMRLNNTSKELHDSGESLDNAFALLAGEMQGLYATITQQYAISSYLWPSVNPLTSEKPFSEELQQMLAPKKEEVATP